MKTQKNLGIWMDHSTANLIDLDVKKNKPSIASKFTSEVELHNYLNKDLHFATIKIDTKSADNMTYNEQVAFVKKHFNLL